MPSRPLIYIGIDPGLADAGYGVIAVAGAQQRCIAYGSIRTSKEMPAEQRLAEIDRQVAALLEKYRPDHVALEKLFFQKNAKTAMAVAEARGVIRLCLARANVAVKEVNPRDVKIAVCGHGAADKKQVQRMVATLLALQEVPKPDDAADALALALTLAAGVGLARRARLASDHI